ncbi:ABC transporter permease [Sporomusa aerivorans]|uniref:ABC transporter permease n=1 Tax=Sporomusa aerivorans TaxID=204936 RepID=UPI00352A2E3E
MHSLKDEIAYLFSGRGMPYHKVSIMVALVVTIAFTAVFSNNYIKDGKVAVIDLDNSKFSREFIEEMNASPYIRIKEVLNVPVDPKQLLHQDRNIAVIYLPDGFEKNGYSNAVNNIGVFYDNTNAAQSASIRSGLNAIVAMHNQKIGSAQIQALGFNSEQTSAVMNNISLKERLLFNPTGSASNSTTLGFLFFFSSMYFVFATIGIISRLRLEGKWNEQLLETSPFELMLRLIPYAICLTVSLVAGLAILRIIGDLSFMGNFFVLLLSIMLLAASAGLMSMLFGWGAANPGIAASRMILFLPGGFILGGMTSPIDILPSWVQVVFNVFPLVWEFRFTRDIILRGAAFMDTAQEFGGFMIYTGVLALLVCIRFYQEQKSVLAKKSANAKESVPDAGR